MKNTTTLSAIVSTSKLKAHHGNLSSTKSTSILSSHEEKSMWNIHSRDITIPSASPVSLSSASMKDLDTNDDIQSISSALELTQSNVEIKDSNLLDLQLNAARKLRQVWLLVGFDIMNVI